MPYKEVAGLKIRIVSYGDTIIPEDHNHLVEALKNIKDRLKSWYGVPSDIDSFIEGLRKVSKGDYVYASDITDIKKATLDLIDYAKSVGYKNSYLSLAETYAKMVPDVRSGDIIEPLHHNCLVNALENLDNGTETKALTVTVVKAGRFEAGEIFNFPSTGLYWFISSEPESIGLEWYDEESGTWITVEFAYGVLAFVDDTSKWRIRNLSGRYAYPILIEQISGIFDKASVIKVGYLAGEEEFYFPSTGLYWISTIYSGDVWLEQLQEGTWERIADAIYGIFIYVDDTTTWRVKNSTTSSIEICIIKLD